MKFIEMLFSTPIRTSLSVIIHVNCLKTLAPQSRRHLWTISFKKLIGKLIKSLSERCSNPKLSEIDS